MNSRAIIVYNPIFQHILSAMTVISPGCEGDKNSLLENFLTQVIKTFKKDEISRYACNIFHFVNLDLSNWFPNK